MKKLIFAMLTMLGITSACCQQNFENIPYVEAKNYFVRNDVTDVPTKITTQEDFDKYFGMAAFMGKDGEPTKIDFENQYVLALTAPETDKETTLEVKSLKKEDGKIVLTYNQQTDTESRSFTIRPLLMLLVDKKHDGEVELIIE